MECNNQNKQENKKGIVYIGNAFSTRMMVGDGDVHIRTISEKEFEEVKSTAHSIVGHPDTANVLGVKMNRESITLSEGDVLYIAEIKGGKRLPEGATKLPEGFAFTYKKVWVTYPIIKMGRKTHTKSDVEEVHIIHDIHDDSAYFVIKNKNGDEYLEKAYYSDIKTFTQLWRGVPIIEFIDDGCTCTPITKEVEFKWRNWNHTIKRCDSESHPWGIFRDGELMFSISKYSVMSAKKTLQAHWDWIHEPFEDDIFY